MKKLSLIAALLLAASPVAAQSRQQALGAGGQTNNSPLANTGIICEQEITATFCNVATSPNNRGYGSSRGSISSGGSASGGGYTSSAGSASSGVAGSSTSSIPPCGAFPPPNELCY
jgi:hypothetical protein